MVTKRPAKRKTTPTTLADIVAANHKTMTLQEMSEKFGHTVDGYRKVAKKLGLSVIPFQRKQEDKPKPPLKKRPTKPRKDSMSVNPEKVKSRSYEGMRLVSLGVDNQYFYVREGASKSEIEKERQRRMEIFEERAKRNRLSKF